jgi:hypothetical protein
MSSADPATQFQQGFALHRQGRLDEAEAIYRGVLASQPARFGALHFTGLIHYQRGAFAPIATYPKAEATLKGQCPAFPT